MANATRMIFPMIFGRRYADKLTDGSSTPLQLVRLQIEQQVNAKFPLIHQIATTMTFKNTHNIILEGAFEFTLPEKATICGYGLDVDGTIVDGVVVEKQTARIAFEKEVRKRIDPGFVELVTGNVFRTRVYPIEPNKTRTVRVIYQDQANTKDAAFLYQIPIQFQTHIESLDVVLKCFNKTENPPDILMNFPNKPMQFIRSENDQYIAELHLTNVEPIMHADQSLSYALPNSVSAITSAVEHDSDIGAYFVINCTLPKPTVKVKNQFDLSTKRICILWDASLSRANSKENRLLEINALKNIFDLWLARSNLIELTIIVFRNTIEQPFVYQLFSNNFNELSKFFSDLIYDGATNLYDLSTINLNDKIDYYFVFSDCISTINNDSVPENLYSNFKAPLWIFNGNFQHEPYDIDFIRYITQFNQYGGGYLNRDKLESNPNELINLLETNQIKYVKINSNFNIKEIYPSNSIHIPVDSDRFLLVGQIPKPLPSCIPIQLDFSMNNETASVSIVLDIPSDLTNQFGLIRRLWAQEKLNQLNAFKDKNKSDILSLGLQHSLVSHFTSLLVLETLQQHIQYSVCPAKTRTNLYNQYIQYQKRQDHIKVNRWNIIVEQWKQKCQRYDRVITDTDIHRAYLTKCQHVWEGFGSTVGMPMALSGMPVATLTTSTDMPLIQPSIFPLSFGNQKVPAFTASQPSSFASSAFGSTGFNFSQNTSQPIPTPTNFHVHMNSQLPSSTKTVETPTITINEYDPNSSYITRISSAISLSAAYSIYVDERTSYRQSVSFYFDIANYFFSPKSFSSVIDNFNQNDNPIKLLDEKSVDYGLRILTNILELELEAPQLYRTVAYKLIELKHWKLALSILRKIYSLRSDEPQTLYDLANVLVELGEHGQALEYLKRIHTETWDERFRTIQTIALMDLNRLLALMNMEALDIDSRLLRHLPVDIRIVVQWDTPDTLISLSVNEPTGQICHSSSSCQTDIGGCITAIPFQADQPIEYTLRKAVDGTYSISLTYTRSAQHTLTGVTTALIRIYKYFGSLNEEKHVTTVRLTTVNQIIEIGKIKFGDSNMEQLKSELKKYQDECTRLQNQIITGKKLNLEPTVQHTDFTCDGCSQSPIIGPRYKCLYCPNIDLCQNCLSWSIPTHTFDHPLIYIRDSKLYASSIFVCNLSDVQHANSSCATCSASPIIGIRYQCTICNINICSKCEFRCLHPASHPLLKFVFAR